MNLWVDLCHTETDKWIALLKFPYIPSRETNPTLSVLSKVNFHLRNRLFSNLISSTSLLKWMLKIEYFYQTEIWLEQECIHNCHNWNSHWKFRKGSEILLDKTTITFQSRKFVIVDHYYAKTLDLLTWMRICCSVFIVVQSMTPCFLQENVMMQ